MQRLAGNWRYDVVSIPYPGPVLRDCPVAELHHLGRVWAGFDFEKTFHCPVQLVNDTAMLTLGSSEAAEMFFLGLGTGPGSTLIMDGIAEPMELGHLPYREGSLRITLGHAVGKAPLEKMAALCRGRGGPPVGCSGTGLLIPGGDNAKELNSSLTVAAQAKTPSRCWGDFRLLGKGAQKWKRSPNDPPLARL